MTPCGETLDELIGDLKIMLEDTKKWEPVEFDEMKPGMVFERRKKYKRLKL